MKITDTLRLELATKLASGLTRDPVGGPAIRPKARQRSRLP